jgi:hypothetical protein
LKAPVYSASFHNYTSPAHCERLPDYMQPSRDL